MPTGLIISVLFHAALLGWAWFVIQTTPEHKIPDTATIEATIITLSELTRLKKGDPDAKVLEAKAEEKPQPEKSQKEAEKPKPITAPEPPAPPPPPPEEAKTEPPPPEPAKAEPPPPPPGPTPDEQKALDEKLEQEKKAEEAKKAEEQRKAEEKKKADELKKRQEREKRIADAKKKAEEAKKRAFDTDKIAALLDKTPDKKGAPPVANTPPNEPTNNTGPAAGEREGNDTVLSAREADMLKGMLKQQLAPCWRLPGGGGGTSVPVVELKWRLRPDGSLDGEPSVTRPASGPAGQIAAEAALRAVKGCQPFRLPAESYQRWKDVIWEFDPSQML